MSQITNSRIKQLKEALDVSHFTAAGFITTFPDANSYLAEIRFADNSDYYFFLKEEYKSGYSVQYSPGDVKVSTKADVESFEDCIVYLGKWTQNISDELVALSPFYNELEHFKKEFLAKLDEHVKDPLEHFSKKEIEELRIKLDEFSNNLNKFRDEQIITAQELKAAQQSLAELKANLPNLPKKTWLRSAGSKIIEITGKAISSEAGQKILGKTIDKLLDTPK